MTRTDTPWAPSPRQEALILELSTVPFPNLKDAAIRANIPVQTAKRWNCDPRFQALVEVARSDAALEHRAALERKIAGVADEALEVKLAIMRNPNASPYVRAQEAQYFLDRLLGKVADRIEHTGRDGEAMKVEQRVGIDLDSISDDDLAVLERIVTGAVSHHGAVGETPLS